MPRCPRRPARICTKRSCHGSRRTVPRTSSSAITSSRRIGTARNAATRGETEALVTTAEHAVDVFGALGDDLGLARAWRRLGLVAHTERRFADAAAACERALPHALASGDEQERARVADLLCTALLFGPARGADPSSRPGSVSASPHRNLRLRA